MAERSAETPRVESFVLRFVEDTPDSDPAPSARSWHAVILHVQSKEEKSFAHFADAVAFIARFVPVGGFVFSGQTSAIGTDSDRKLEAGGEA